jgi:hypothetical protein
MKLLRVLKFAKNAGRIAMGGGAVTAGLTINIDEVISLIGALTALAGAVTEGLVRVIEAWAKANNRV